MKKFLVIAVVIAAMLAATVPASALEVKYGGLFRSRVLNDSDWVQWAGPADNLGEGILSQIDHLNRLDQRLRIFMYFVASENLRVVTKFEANTVWGDLGSSPSGGRDFDLVGGGEPGADVANFGVKNAYVDFAIPGTPARAMIGVQGIALIDSWIVDDDFSAAVFTSRFDNFTVTGGYIAGQNFNYLRENENIDDLFLAVDYAGGPWRASVIGFWQYAHDTMASVFPQTMNTPVYSVLEGARGNNGTSAFASSAFIRDPFEPQFAIFAKDNNLFDLGFSLTYKIDYLSAYVNFVKNLGSVKLFAREAAVGTAPALPDAFEYQHLFTDTDYTGWMVDAGLNYFCGPWTLNIGGFYTTGQKLTQTLVRDEDEAELEWGPVVQKDVTSIDWFTYPMTTNKYFSEIMGGGILDNTAPNAGYWRGYPFPFNIWTITVGAAWQVLPQTKLSASYWYFGTSEKVPSHQSVTGEWAWSSDLGHEFDFYLTQGIVDRLTLDLVAAYMITGDAYRPQPFGSDFDNEDNTYELGARIQWAF